MFGLFRRTKLKTWEINLLLKVLKSLPDNHSKLVSQIEDGLLRGVLVDVSDIPGYVAFTYNSGVVKRYEDKNDPGYQIVGIQVYDIYSSSFRDYVIYVSNGMINGYSIDKNGKLKIDINNIQTSKGRKVLRDSSINEFLSNILTVDEKVLIDWSKVYPLELDNKTFYNIKDLEDGDFIGIDTKKKLYKISHDPLEIKQLDGSLEMILKD